MNREEFYQKLFARALEAGAEACEVYFAASNSFSVSVFGGEITDYSVAQRRGLGFRVLREGKMGYASTQALDEEAIDLLVDAALENAALIQSANKQFLFAGGCAYRDLPGYNPALEQIGAADKIALCRDLERLCAQVDPRIRPQAESSVFSEDEEIELRNTLGLRARYRRNLMGGCVEPVAVQGERTNSGFALFFGNDPAALDARKSVEQAAREALDGLEARSVPSGTYRVLLRSDAACDLLAAFAGVFCADRAQKGLSLLAGREGERIAAECVDIRDDPHMPGQCASAPFDAEGVPTAAHDLVVGGVLKTLLHNLETAHKQSVSTTANAARAGYGASVSVSPSNLCVLPGAHDRDRLLALLGDGLLVTSLQGLHSGCDSVSGDFSLSIKGYRVRGGRVEGALAEATLSGNFFSLLRDVQAVGDQMRFRHPASSACASPDLLVGNLSVAGK